jgi:hypothetical protein
METCSECGCPLQSLDLPCPRCAARESLPPQEMVHTHSKTFECRPGPFKYRPDEFAAEVNQWLAEQTGLRNLTMTLHFFHTQISSVTANCTATSDPEIPVVRLERLSLGGGFLGRKRQTPGVALNDWAERHPKRRRLNYWSVASGGTPVELWLLYVEQKDWLTEFITEPEMDEPQTKQKDPIGIKKRNRALLGLAVGLGAVAAAVSVSVLMLGHSHGNSQVVDSPHSSTPHVAVLRNVDSCALLSTAKIEYVLGSTSLKPPARSQTGDGSDECTYLTSSGGPTVTVQAGTALAQFASRFETTSQNIPGIGSQAAEYSNFPGAAILARQGSKWVDVYIEYVPPTRALPDAETLAAAALNQLTDQ